MSDAESFLMSTGGVPSARFKQVGDSVTGYVFYPPQVQQQRDFDTQEPLFWKDGSPRNQLKVVIHSEQLVGEEGEDDQGLRALYVKGNMQRAIADAVRKAGARRLEVGGKLRVTYEGNGEAARKGLNPPKVYSALYRAPEPKAEDEEVLTAEDKADLAALTGEQPKGNSVSRPKPEAIPF